MSPHGGPGLGRRALLRRGLVPALAALAVLVRAPAGATHLPDHRFIVLGYVHDDDGKPLADAPVVLTRVKTGLQHPARSEKDGFFLVVVHLHDEDEGERLRIRGRGASLDLRARFDVSQKKVERGTRADFRSGIWREDRARFAETLRAFIAR